MSNGHHHNQNSPNSTTYFDRIRKESAGHTPFTIFDTTVSVPTQSSNNATVGSSTTLGTSHADKENNNVAPSISTRRSGQAIQTNYVINPKTGSSIGRSTVSSNLRRNNWERGGYVVAANPADSSRARSRLGRLHNPRAARLYDAPIPQKAVLNICSTEDDKEKSKYYQAPFEVVMVQSQEIAQLNEDRDELFSRVEDLEDQVAAATKPSRRCKMRFPMKKGAPKKSSYDLASRQESELISRING